LRIGEKNAQKKQQIPQAQHHVKKGEGSALTTRGKTQKKKRQRLGEKKGTKTRKTAGVSPQMGQKPDFHENKEPGKEGPGRKN